MPALSEIGALIVVDRGEAERRIVAAFEKAGANKLEAAKQLGVNEATFHRWIATLGIAAKLRTIGEKAAKEGWGQSRGRPRGAAGKEWG